MNSAHIDTAERVEYDIPVCDRHAVRGRVIPPGNQNVGSLWTSPIVVKEDKIDAD